MRIALWLIGTVMLCAQDPGDVHFDYRFGIPGTSYYQKRVCVDPRNGDVYVGGDEFTHAGTIEARNIAKWVRATGAWQALGSGLLGGNPSPEVKAMAVDPRNGDLYVVGGFTTAGGNAANGIAKWNGTTWSALGAGKPGASVITIDPNNGDVFVAGSGTGTIAKWNGTEWSNVGTGVVGTINTMLFHGASNALYVAGSFYTNDAKKVYGLAKWNGTAWDSVGFSVTGNSGTGSATVSSIAIDGSTIYIAANSYMKIGGKTIPYIGKWNGSAWSAVDSLLSESITSLAVENGELYAVGVRRQSQAYNGGLKNFAKFSNGRWEPYGHIAGYASAQIEQLATYQNEVLIAGRQITGLGAVNAKNVGRFLTQTKEWAPLFSRSTQGIDMSNGSFIKTTTGQMIIIGNIRVPFSPGIMRWNGGGWSPVGRGLYYGVSSSGEPTAVTAGENGDFYVAGKISFGLNPDSFKVAVNSVIKWNGTTNTWQALGTGTYDNAIYALAYRNGKLYMGGSFTMVSNSKIKNLAVWDGAKWDSVTSVGAAVRSIAFAPNGDLVIGGQFTSLAGNSLYRYLAKWNGTQWDSIGARPGAQVRKVLYRGSTLYASGDFTSIGGTTINQFAKWNGTQWDTVSNAVTNVNDFAFQGDTLFVAGVIAGLGYQFNNGAGYFVNGQWTKMGSGFQNASWTGTNGSTSPNHLFVDGADVWCIGNYNIVGGRAALAIARWNSTDAISSVQRIAALPDGFALEQNYPNPFNPSTAVRFTVNTAGITSLKVYDVIGREVATLVNEQLAPGTYDARFDGSALASGFYLYRLQSGTNTVTKKMLLVK
jgi:hypothetical protein